MIPRIILASESVGRRELLARLGLPFESRAHQVDEDAFKRRIGDPAELTRALATAKAEAVAARFPGALVIGSDQVAELDGEILGKPGSTDRAVAQLTRLAGREHRLITSVHVASGGRVECHTDVTRLRMKPLSTERIERYIAADRPEACAGSYRIESRGIGLFESIVTEDFTAIIGLPMLATTRILERFGVPL
jgi:septum formation protein